MAPNMGNLELKKEELIYERLVAPSADSWKFKTQHPVLFVSFLLYVFAGFYGGYVCVTSAKLSTVFYTLFMVIPSMLGLTVGVHRLWSHRAFKAKPQLETLLVFFYLLANQRSIVTWARTHRLHHKCSDTDGDPHNATRGFFFSHFWWMVVKPHPEVLKRENMVDVSDLMNNPIVRFQEKYINTLLIVVAYIIPTLIPMLWGESLYVAIFVNLFRQNLVLHLINSINSVTHLIGYKPIDKTTAGTQFPLVGILTFGEGFHNYHHAFPYDHSTSEFGDNRLNLGTRFIKLMAKIGWAYDLKTTSEVTVRDRVWKMGDGTDQHYIPHNARKQDFCCTTFYKETSSFLRK